MSTARFYHAGCSVCVSAEQTLLNLLDPALKVEVVHLGEQPQRIAEAERVGVKSVPAFVHDGQVLHLNFGASIDDLK
ncbi:thioredoxin family protein [Pseudomonas proteolytica]|jgi:glutaredoxin|nr:thioredoxin family protein [Pseudomonas proteolytica]USW97581.1 thioredoxin family protein [Pseudomonas proteolytica]USW98181.1 thioredoxin family protein [Pseudomonas proteolytica]